METNEEYHADTARLSNSMLSVLAKRNGPQLFDGYYVSKTLAIPEQTESMALGEMVHCLSLEPEEYINRFAFKPDGLDRVKVAGKAAWKAFESNRRLADLYVPKPDISRRTATGKEEYDAIVLDRIVLEREDFDQACYFFKELCRISDKTIVKLEDYETSEGCANAILTHDSLDMLNTCEAMVEKRIDFELDGVPMRCKPDWVSLDLQLIIDIKTTQNAGPEFAKSASEFGYYRQAWIYRQAVRLQTGIDCRFLFACVETAKPYSVACYEPSDAMMLAGENDAMALLAEYRYRYETDDWLQEWSKGIVPLDLPAWFKQRNFYDEMKTQ